MTNIVDEWATYLRATGHTDATITQRTQWVRRLAREIPVPLLTITAADVQGWLAHPSWKKTTRRAAQASLRQFYRWAVLTGHTDLDPTVGLPPIREPAPCPRPVPEDVFGRALAAAGPREYLAILLGGCCGLRASEAARVHANDVTSDFYGPVIIVHGKGEVVRLVPISVEVKAVLASAFKVSPFGWAFPNMNDMRLHVTGAALSKACRPYLEGHTFHALRHRYASKIYATSGDLLSTQQLLGHASPVTTQRYVAVDRARLRNAARGAA